MQILFYIRVKLCNSMRCNLRLPELIQLESRSDRMKSEKSGVRSWLAKFLRLFIYIKADSLD